MMRLLPRSVIKCPGSALSKNARDRTIPKPEADGGRNVFENEYVYSFWVEHHAAACQMPMAMHIPLHPDGFDVEGFSFSNYECSFKFF
jgi:hypothetical protein